MTLIVDRDLVLRPLEVAEANAVFALIHADRLDLRAWVSWVDGTASADDTKAFIQATRVHGEHKKSFTFGLWEGGRVAGVVGTHLIDWPNRTTSLGYWLGTAFRGRGLITQSVKALMGHLFTEHHLHRLEIRCAVANAKSRAIPERLGFQFEGVLRQGQWLYDHFVDLALYSRLATDPAPASTKDSR